MRIENNVVFPFVLSLPKHKEGFAKQAHGTELLSIAYTKGPPNRSGGP